MDYQDEDEIFRMATHNCSWKTHNKVYEDACIYDNEHFLDTRTVLDILTMWFVVPVLWTIESNAVSIPGF
jgi:hypothetical protein